MRFSSRPSQLTFWLSSGAVVAALLLTGALLSPRDIVLWNGTQSMPTGLYWRTDRAPERGAVVTVRAADVAPAIATRRRFTDPGDRFLKRIAAGSGDVVCAQADTIFINGEVAARRRRVDSNGDPLPVWHGCRSLENEFFLLGESEDSFDSRYFGPVRRADIEGVWRR